MVPPSVTCEAQRESINNLILVMMDGAGLAFLPQELLPRINCCPVAPSADSAPACNYLIDSFAPTIRPFVKTSKSKGLKTC